MIYDFQNYSFLLPMPFEYSEYNPIQPLFNLRSFLKIKSNYIIGNHVYIIDHIINSN